MWQTCNLQVKSGLGKALEERTLQDGATVAPKNHGPHCEASQRRTQICSSRPFWPSSLLRMVCGNDADRRVAHFRLCQKIDSLEIHGPWAQGDLHQRGLCSLATRSPRTSWELSAFGA